MRRCEACEGEFEPEGRERFCRGVECRRSRARDRKRSSRGGEVVDLPDPDVPDDLSAPSNFEVTHRALVAADRLLTPAGVNALTLARRLDAASMEPGSSLAAVSKQHLAALEEATRNASSVADPIDELRARRERRRTGS